MSDYRLMADVPVCVTPSGAYHAATAREDDAARRVLFGILSQPRTPVLTLPALVGWAGLGEEDALALLHRMQFLGWIAAEPVARDVPSVHMDEDMPALLSRMSARKRAMLADAEGFQLASSGFTHEAAEQLAALAAELTAVHQRYHGLVHGNLRLNAGGIALVDAAGHGQVCVWPLTLGSQSFLLIVAGVPLLHGRAFADAIWGLAHRYATPA